jgi:AraC-like DNA-binding protein
MFEYIPYLSFLTSGIGLFFICFLVLRFGQVSKVYGLVFIIFAVVFLEFYIYALTSKHIFKMLFLLRTPNIIRAFLPIALFLYVRSMLTSDYKISGWQFFHFIFPVLIMIGVMPDLFLSAAEKVNILNHYYAHNKYFISTPSGWIPAGFVQPISILVGIGYGFATIRLIYLTKKKQGSEYGYVNKQSLIWLNMLSGAVTIYFLLQFYQYANLFVNNSFDPPSQMIKCVIGIFLFTYFITTPNVQENMDGCIEPKGRVIPMINDLLPSLLEEFNQEANAIIFDQQVKESRDFLDSNFDQSSMAKKFDIPPTKLSKFIKSYYGMSFAEFINRLRIHHFLSQRGDFDQFTLETYIYQSGFSNRSTFYAAFKKYVGVNPSFYLKEVDV